MDLADAISKRRSIRRYHEVAISDDAVEYLLSAACWAPSAHNRQPWRFSILRTSSAKRKLAEAMGARLQTDRRRDGDEESIISSDVARSRIRIVDAPLAVVVSMSLIDMDHYPDEVRANAERVMAIQSTAMAVQNLLLAATALGFGACWMCAPLFCHETVRAALDLPDDWQPQALVTVGLPANRGKPGRRRPIADLVREVDR
jgi:coenzyme F420-0:L-glutamate ligase/coenzyme F420-1:gamma-L-glutamate ligase